jgi:hypothetical protein
MEINNIDIFLSGLEQAPSNRGGGGGGGKLGGGEGDDLECCVC